MVGVLENDKCYLMLMMDSKNYGIFIVSIFGIPSHIIRFIRNLKQANPSVEITLFSDRPYDVFSQDISGIIKEYIRWDRKPSKFFSRLSQFKFLKGLLDYVTLSKKLNQISKSGHYDIVNIHYPQYFMCYVMRQLKRMSSSIVVSPWGSDVLRLEGIVKRRKLARVFRKADYTTAGKKGEIGKMLINEMGIDENKFHPLSWGSETIDYINEHLSEVMVEQAKRQLGLESRYVITCGYNAFEEQRHEVMIRAIQSIRNQLPDNLTLLFPVTYGYSYGTRKKEYVESLKQLCERFELNAVFYEDYLPVSDLFFLRLATDMFVHIQPTDGGNSSLQEYVLCGKKVVHGTWIHYPKLEKYEPLFYFPVEDLEHLDEVILNAYHSENIKVPTEVMEFIRNRGWKAKMKLWNEFFVSIVNN